MEMGLNGGENKKLRPKNAAYCDAFLRKHKKKKILYFRSGQRWPFLFRKFKLDQEHQKKKF